MVNRRSFTPEFKAQVVLELIRGAKNLAEACRQYQLKPEMVSRWKAEFLEKAPSSSRKSLSTEYPVSLLCRTLEAIHTATTRPGSQMSKRCIPEETAI